jgi:hypothetical protein
MLSKLSSRFSRQVQLRKVINVEVFDYHGEVYDFQSISTLSSANGIICSNCRGTWIPHFMLPGEA